MNVARMLTLAVTVSGFFSVSTFAGEKTVCEHMLRKPRCSAQFTDCRTSCHKYHYRHAQKAKSRYIARYPSSRYPIYEREAGIGWEGYPVPAAPMLQPAFARPEVPLPVRSPYPPRPSSGSTFNFYGPTNNFFGPLPGSTYPVDGGGATDSMDSDYRLDPWHGYDSRDGLRNGY
jgi:hypothetical protein